MDIREIGIGTKLELELYDEMGEKINPTLVSQFEYAANEKMGIVAAPISEGVVFPVRIGWSMTVYFMQKDDLYKFKAKVTGRGIKDNIAFLKIEAIGEIEKIQRRLFFRFECSSPIEYRVIDNLYEENKSDEPMKPALTRDISGGGVCIKLKEHIRVNTLIMCELALGEGKKVSFIGKVVRSSKRREDPVYEHEIGIIFKKIENRDKEAVIRFIFEEQRKLRKKGLI